MDALDHFIATIGVVAGTALLAGGIALILVAPSRTSTARRGAAPAVAGLLLRGRW